MLKLFKTLFGSGAGAEFDSHRVCPECGSPLYDESTAQLHESACPNLDCPARIRKLIARWCSREAMDIPISIGLIALLVRCGLIRDVAELYRLKLREIEALEGMNAAAARGLFDALTASLKRDPWRVLFGLSIPSITTVDALALCRKFGSVDNVIAAGAERLALTEGISQTAAKAVAQWSSDPVNRRLVKRLSKAGVHL
jgi:DNA ligase (NAD+)